MSKTPQQRMDELIEEFSTAMLVTTSLEGELRARPMAIATLKARIFHAFRRLPGSVPDNFWLHGDRARGVCTTLVRPDRLPVVIDDMDARRTCFPVVGRTAQRAKPDRSRSHECGGFGPPFFRSRAALCRNRGRLHNRCGFSTEFTYCLLPPKA
jgi:hypothetical protein